MNAFDEMHTDLAEQEAYAYEFDYQVELLRQRFRPNDKVVVVTPPAPTPDEWTSQRWVVPLYDPLVDEIRYDTRAGEVCIRRSDGRISVTSVPSTLETGDDARRLAAALLACADAWDAQQP